MKVLFIALHFSEYAYCLARELSNTNKVMLVLSKENAQSELEGAEIDIQENLDIVYLPHKRNIQTLVGNTLKLVKLARNFKPDIIHFQEVKREYQTAAFMFLKKWPIVLTVHDPEPHLGADAKAHKGLGRRRNFYADVQRATASGLISHGTWLCQKLAEVTNSDKPIVSVPHGPLGLLIREHSKENQDDFSFLFFGRMQKYKGIELFIEAISTLKEEGLKIRGVLAGRGPEMNRLKGRLKDDPCFVLKDWYLTPKEVAATFHSANAVILPYIEGTQSGVAALSIGHGKPCIITNVGSLPEMVVNGKTGLIINPNNLPELIEAMRSLYMDADKCQQMASNAKILGETEKSWSVAARKTKDFYQLVIKNHNKH